MTYNKPFFHTKTTILTTFHVPGIVLCTEYSAVNEIANTELIFKLKDKEG